MGMLSEFLFSSDPNQHISLKDVSDDTIDYLCHYLSFGNETREMLKDLKYSAEYFGQLCEGKLYGYWMLEAQMAWNDISTCNPHLNGFSLHFQCQDEFKLPYKITLDRGFVVLCVCETSPRLSQRRRKRNKGMRFTIKKYQNSKITKEDKIRFSNYDLVKYRDNVQRGLALYKVINQTFYL